MPRLARSVENVPHSRIRELAEIAMSMDGVLRLYFGESNLPTPDYIKQAAIRAMRDGYTFYTENAGLPSLRRAIAENYRRLHSVDLDPSSEIVVTASGVQALNVGIRCALDPGDQALVLTPAWPNGASSVMMANAAVCQVPHPLSGDRYRVDFDALEAARSPRTRLLVYTSPSNPLGWVATEEDQRRLLDFARRHDLWLLADEVYDRLFYAGARLGDPVPSILRMATRDDAVMVVHSFSKSYCMTGWRVGWLVARRDLAAKATQLNEFIVSHAPSFAQKAGETALAEGEGPLVEMLERLKRNRDLCLDALSGIPGVTVPKPDGAFYLFPRIQGLADSFAFCKRLLEETRVGLAPGVAFGAGGEGSVRICYAAERSILEPAMERLTKFLRQHRPGLTHVRAPRQLHLSPNSALACAVTVQRYTVRQSMLICLSGFHSPMSNWCETMRVPTFNSLSSFGRSFMLTSGSRYSVTTVASWKSASKRFFWRKCTRSVTPACFALSSASLIRSGSMSTPVPVAPNFCAAIITIRPSPQPRSYRMSPFLTSPSFSMASTTSGGVGT